MYNISMIESKYLVFKRIDIPGRKTPVFEIYNKSDECIGLIALHPAWRKFVFYPSSDTIFDAACLSDIIIQMNDATAEWKAGLKK